MSEKTKTWWKAAGVWAVKTMAQTTIATIGAAAVLYYVQDGKIYLCNRDTGNPVYNALVELVGLYVEEVL